MLSDSFLHLIVAYEEIMNFGTIIARNTQNERSGGRVETIVLLSHIPPQRTYECLQICQIYSFQRYINKHRIIKKSRVRREVGTEYKVSLFYRVYRALTLGSTSLIAAISGLPFNANTFSISDVK